MAVQELISKYRIRSVSLIIVALSVLSEISGQLSPGELSLSHSNLEGISNCTQCHVLGNKISADKCLACHTEIRDRISAGKGYHSSVEVKGKICFSCHSEHNGRSFKLIRLETSRFDHNLTGYSLSQPHSETACSGCHKTANISDSNLKSRKSTYLGLGRECLNCHEDYHRQTLSSSCLNCHDENTFKRAPKFNHSSARFKLNGRHRTIDCSKCHKSEMIDGKEFREFRGLKFGLCTDCHKDPHQKRFGQNCRQCHNEESFKTSKGPAGFDHSSTGFPLEEKHITVECRSCHKGKLTDPLRHDKCAYCHSDYHKGEFTDAEGKKEDCSSCHTVAGFGFTDFSLERHNIGAFRLNGSHIAIPCSDCHKKQSEWRFRKIGQDCIDCHSNIHSGKIQPHYLQDASCMNCHNEERWSKISFDHSATKFVLTGSHKDLVCRDCHFRKDEKGVVEQKFYELSSACTSCHSDNHFGQFDKNGINDCSRCHNTVKWEDLKFDHNQSNFRLDGKHAGVACIKCHKPQREGTITYIKYKIEDFRCESCH